MKFSFFLLILIYIISNNVLAQSDSTIAKSEVDKLNSHWGYRVKLVVHPTGDITANRQTNSIDLSLSILKSLESVKDKPDRTYLIKMIIYHEFTHHMQFYKYGSKAGLLANDLVSRTLAETQADVNAGSLMIIMNPDLPALLFSKPEGDVMLSKLMQVMFDMGIRENTIGTHPSKNDRIIAFRLGLMSGISYWFDNTIKRNPQFVAALNMTPQKHKVIMDEVFRVTDYRPPEDILAWSYRQARKIINDDRRLMNDLILITPPTQRTKYDESEDNPFGSYNLTYKNTGQNTLDINMEVNMVQVRRDLPLAVRFHRRINARLYRFELKPGETFTAKDRMNWKKSETDPSDLTALPNNYYPRMIYPGSGDDDQLISCLITSNTVMKSRKEEINYFGLSGKKADYSSFSIYFNKLMTAHLLKDDVRTGIGNIDNTNGKAVAFSSSIQFAENSRTAVVLNKTTGKTSFRLSYKLTSLELLKAKFKEIKGYLSKELSNYVQSPYSVWGNEAMAYISDNSVVDLIMITNPGEQLYVLEMSLAFL